MPPNSTSFQLALLDRFGNKLRAKQALATTVNLTQGLKSSTKYAAECELNIGYLDSSEEAPLM